MITLKKRVKVLRAESETDRQAALKVLHATYREEKNWVSNEEKVFPTDDLSHKDVSWFVVFVDEQPVGVVRVLYSPPLELYREYGFKQIARGINIEDFIHRNRIAEIGRFAVLPEFRKFIVVVAMLMRAASKETIRLGYTHYITDIFEGEKHSPYQFHRRVMGFEPVATHDVGELNCPNRRITMILDLKASYQRLRTNQNWIYRLLTEDWEPELHKRLLDNTPPISTPPPA